MTISKAEALILYCSLVDIACRDMSMSQKHEDKIRLHYGQLRTYIEQSEEKK